MTNLKKGNKKMIRLTSQNTAKAIERCKQLKPKVKFVQDRLFVVYSANNTNVYHVQFDVRNGEKFGKCECAAAEKGLVCYHLVGAAQVNIYRQGLKRQTA
jgi:signal transduction histidine kinase